MVWTRGRSILLLTTVLVTALLTTAFPPVPSGAVPPDWQMPNAADPRRTTILPRGHSAWSVGPGADGRLWYSTDAGVARVSLTGEFEPVGPSVGGPLVGTPDGSQWYQANDHRTISRFAPDGTVVPVATLASGVALDLTAGPDGNLWFTIGDTDGAIGRLTLDGTLTRFPVGRVDISQIRTGADGNLWFTFADPLQPHEIGRVTPDGAITRFPTGDHEPMFPTAGPDGAIWAVDVTPPRALIRVLPDGAIEDVDVDLGPENPYLTGLAEAPGRALWARTSQGVVVRIAADLTTTVIPMPLEADANGMATTADGDLWLARTPVRWSGHVESPLVRVTPAGEVTTFLTPAVAAPRGLTLGPDDAMWYRNTAPATDDRQRFGRMDAEGFTTSFGAPGVTPESLVAGSDGRLWFADREHGRLGAITTGGVVTTFPDLVDQPWGVVAGPDGNVWFRTAHAIGRITPTGTITTFAASPAAQPAGLVAGPGGVWFTDPGRGLLGRVTPAGALTTFAVPGATPLLGDLVPGTDGNLWYVHDGQHVGRATPTGTFTIFGVDGGEGVDDLDVAVDGRILYHAGGATDAWRALTAVGSPAPPPGHRPGATGPNGTTWYADGRNELDYLDVFVPAAPRDVRSVAGTGQVTVSWIPPADPAGTVLTSTVSITNWDSGPTCTTTGTSCTLTGLGYYGTYTFEVTTSNGVITGAPSTSPPATTYRFPDVPYGAPFWSEIRSIADLGITTGYPDGTFRPGLPVERQAMAAFLYRYAGKPHGEHPACGQAPFTDVAPNAPFCGEIAWMRSAGITTGFPDGSFHPNASVERQAMAAFLSRFDGTPPGPRPPCGGPPFADIAPGAPFCAEIQWMKASYLSTGNPGGTFRPNEPVSRQAMAAFLVRLWWHQHPTEE